MMARGPIRWFLLALATAATALAVAQPARSAQRRQGDTGFQIGDMTIKGFRVIDGKNGPGQSITASGPDTTIESIDPKTGAKSRLACPKIVATMGKKQEVARIDAMGGVKYDGERPTPDRKGVQVLQFIGSKGTFFKVEDRLELHGPVTYYVEQPSPSGKGKQWVRGTADSVSYDHAKQLLKLDGNVNAKVYDLENYGETPQTIKNVSELTVDMSTTPYLYHIVSGSIELTPKKDKPKGNP